MPSSATLAETIPPPPKRPRSAFSSLRSAEPDSIMQLRELFLCDPHPSKLSLGLGIYRTEQNEPYLLESVRRAEQSVLAAQAEGQFSKDYLPPDGLRTLCAAAANLVFGDSLDERGAMAGQSLMSLQTCGGTGALRLGFGLLRAACRTTVLVPDPTWASHEFILATEGMSVQTYRYFDGQSCRLDLAGMCEDLQNAPEGSVVLLHASGHNPTGCDPSHEQWRTICDTIEQREHFAFFDLAYQGLTSGDFDADAWSVRHFARRGTLEMAVAQSFSKNMGLYSERVGTLSIVCSDPDKVSCLRGLAKTLVRTQYSSPPAHGARVAAKILTDEVLFEQWRAEVAAMAERIRRVRVLLHKELVAINCASPARATSPKHVADVPLGINALATPRHFVSPPGSPQSASSCWGHLVQQAGMFSFTGLTMTQVERLRTQVR